MIITTTNGEQLTTQALGLYVKLKNAMRRSVRNSDTGTDADGVYMALNLKYLCKLSGWSVCTIRKYLADLEQVGLVKITRPSRRRPRHIYVLERQHQAGVQKAADKAAQAAPDPRIIAAQRQLMARAAEAERAAQAATEAISEAQPVSASQTTAQGRQTALECDSVAAEQLAECDKKQATTKNHGNHRDIKNHSSISICLSETNQQAPATHRSVYHTQKELESAKQRVAKAIREASVAAGEAIDEADAVEQSMTTAAAVPMYQRAVTALAWLTLRGDAAVSTYLPLRAQAEYIYHLTISAIMGVIMRVEKAIRAGSVRNESAYLSRALINAAMETA